MHINLTKFTKTISILTVLIMVGANFLPVGVYAASEISQTANTKEENVKLDATINGSYDANLVIGGQANLEILASVENSGYIKDTKVILEGNNYLLQKVENENIKAIKDNEILLNETQEDQPQNVIIPIAFNKADLQTEQDFYKESTIKLETTYVNGEGKEKKIEKTIKEKVKWDVKSVEEISQKLIRYIQYEDKTLVTFEITEGIKDNTIPVKSKEMSIVAPTINGQIPVKTIVSGNGIEYKSEKGETKVKKVNTPIDNNKYTWTSQEKYLITYIYNAQTSSKTIATNAIATVVDINNNKIEGKTQKNDYEVNGQLGSLVEVQADTTAEVNKGYMYTSTKRAGNKLNTLYTTNYRINVGFAEVIDGIKAYESEVYFANENGDVIKKANDGVQVSKVKVSKDHITSVLGENGVVTIKDENGNVVAKLNKNETEKDIKAKRVTIETTKPVTEGTIEVAFLKSIVGEAQSSKEEISIYRALTTTLINEGYNGETLVSNAQTNSSVKLAEPTTKASIDMNTTRLSTIVENKNVSLNIVLNKNDIADALYTNPTLKIKFPEEVTKVAVTSARVLYEDEIKAGSIEVNEREIVLKLQGEQTQYNKSTTTAGTLIKIDTNIGLNMLAPSNKKNITLEYTNEYTGETKTASKEIEIIAPSGFVTTNTISIDGQSVTALEDDIEPIKVRAMQNAKTMEISANIVNNLDTSANGLTVLGRIPSEGNKTIGGKDLGSTITTTLASAVETTGLEDAVVYYSDNINEAVNGSGWKTEPTINTKSFKIVTQSPLADKSGATFKYTVTVPENLEYEKQVKENFGIYYNNDSEQGATTNLVESKSVGIMTGVAPAIKTEISAFDTNQGYAIDNNGKVTEGEYVTYRVKVSNTGSYDAHNVKVVAKIPDALAIVKKEMGIGTSARNGYYIDETTKSSEITLETLAGGEEQVLELNTKVTQILQDTPEEEKKISVEATTSADILEEDIQTKHTVTDSEGTLNLKLFSYQENFEYVEPNGGINYEIRVYNPTINAKNNVTVKLKLPQGTTLDTVLDEYENSYDEKNNEVSIKVATIAPADNALILVRTKNNSDQTTLLKANATAIADGMNEEAVSNTVELKNEVPNQTIKATQSTNLTSNITDNDELHFYINIENQSNTDKTVTIEDSVNDELRVNRYEVAVDGNSIARGEVNYIKEFIQIPAGKSAKVTIVTDPYTQQEGTSLNITNVPRITTINGDEVNINEVSVQIAGTEEINEEISEEANAENAVAVKEPPKFKLTGQIWIDENQDGVKQLEEMKVPGIELKIIDNISKKIAINEDGSEVTAITDSNGSYVFENIKNGEYVVIAKYNNNEYETARYRAEGIIDSENSDFVNAKYNEEIVAATDVIIVNNNSQYNIDMGIVKKQKFDLAITKTISKITVSNSEEGTKQFDVNNDKVRVELSQKQLESSTILVEYNIQVTNNGDIAGYAKSIVDYLPKGMNFNSELNKDWYLSKDGNLYTASLANVKLEPGQSTNIKLVLTRNVTNGNVGIIRGKTALDTTYNERGLQDISTQTGLQINADGNMATTDVIIAKTSQGKALFAIGISLGIIAIIGFVIFALKKHLDKKYYVDSNI